VYLAEKLQIRISKISFSKAVLEPMAYHTRGELADHHTIDVLNITGILRTVE